MDGSRQNLGKATSSSFLSASLVSSSVLNDNQAAQPPLHVHAIEQQVKEKCETSLDRNRTKRSLHQAFLSLSSAFVTSSFHRLQALKFFLRLPARAVHEQSTGTTWFVRIFDCQVLLSNTSPCTRTGSTLPSIKVSVSINISTRSGK